ncbi:MAG TPA: aspartate/glutamate racemase family protein [Anaerolineae bacterium]|nr:aspartate/glutamate racemase family protein [Anaerolineae bacterium]
MKTIGLIGGMSWESTSEYYRLINQYVKERLGGLHSAICLLYSFDFAEIERLQTQDEWGVLTDRMIAAATTLEKGGADCLVICTNTMHIMADSVQENITIPLLHIVDAAAENVNKNGLKVVGLLGTRFTMERDFYKDRLKQKHGIDVLVPEREDRYTINAAIYDELCQGVIRKTTKQKFFRIIEALITKGAEGIVLGCTEIPLLIQQKDVSVPVFDTTTIHARKAVEFALG